MTDDAAKPFSRRFRDAIWSVLRRTDPGYRLWLWRRYGLPLHPTGRPLRRPPCAVLREQKEVEEATREVESLALPPLGMPAKFWDALTAVGVVLDNTSRIDRVLDAGAELYSPVLPWLARYGYRSLVGCNLVFDAEIAVGPIRYEHGDITNTRYDEEQFAAITCMSVIEHGVELPLFFAEMARILRPGGMLIVSTDYWQDPIDTGGRMMFGVPQRIFSAHDIAIMIEEARRQGFHLLAPFDPVCGQPVIEFAGLCYTFLLLTFRRAS